MLRCLGDRVHENSFLSSCQGQRGLRYNRRRMRSPSILFSLLVLFLFGVETSFGLDGRVTLPTGEPVANAEISILGLSGVVTTDAEGLFSWTPDPVPPFSVLVILSGDRYMAPILVEATKPGVRIDLVVEPLLNESVTVSSGVTPNIEATPAGGMNVIPREDIAERKPTRLTDVLENIPGASQLSDLHAGVPSIRGLARGRTLILLDGARVTTERRAGPSATFLDPMFLEAVEVVRGPGSVAYGTDAFGGVIHARSKDVAPKQPLKLRLQGSFGAGLPERGGGVEISKGFESGGLLFQTRYRRFDSYRSPDGEVFNSEASDGGVLVKGNHRLGSGTIELGWQSHMGRDTGRPTTNSDFDQIVYPREDSHRLNIGYDWDPRGGFTLLSLKTFWGKYRLVTDRFRLDLRSFEQSNVDASDFSVRGRAIRPFGRARIEFGTDINGRYGLNAIVGSSQLLAGNAEAANPVVSEEAIGDARRIDAAMYASGELLLGDRLSVTTGGRVGRITTRNSGGIFSERSTADTGLSGFGSIKVEIAPGLSGTGQFSTGFRDPSLSDRYFAGISGRGFVTGNPDLLPESAQQWDTAMRYVRGQTRLALYFYRYRFTDLIERFEATPQEFFFRNRGEAILRGVEFELQSTLRKHWFLELGAQTSRGTADGETALDDIPTDNLTLELRRNLSERYYATVRTAIFTRDSRPGPTETLVRAYASLDLGMGARLSDEVQLRITLGNLTDVAYPVSADARAVLAPGRTMLATIVAEF